MMAALVVDSDSHIYEPPILWDRFVAPEYRAAARSALFHEVADTGERITVLNGRPARDLNRSRLVRQAIWRPGMTPEDVGGLDPDVFFPLTPGASDPDSRRADMDEVGIDQAIVYPTIFTEYLPLVENPDVAAALARAYNDWIWEFCSGGDARLVPVAVLPLQSVLFSQRELDRVAEKGFGAVLIRPAFFDTVRMAEHGAAAVLRNIARHAGAGTIPGTVDSGGATEKVFVEDIPFRPLWKQIEQLDLVACVHPSPGVAGPENVSQGAFTERVAEKLGIGHSVAEPVAAMQDNGLFLTAAFFHGLLEDHPGLRMALAHSGASWLPLATEKSETYLWLSFASVLEPVSLEPEEVVARHPLVVSFDSWERTVARMPDIFETIATWGSRYPNHDAAGPAEATAMLEEHGVPEAIVERLMGANAADLFRIVDTKTASG
jgi:predicted TIM-barrel fold metal-dependent hydrolase